MGVKFDIFILKRVKQVKQTVNQENIKEQINKGSIILAASYIAVFVLNYLMPFVNNLLIYTILGTIPFLVGGYLFSILFTEFSGISGRLYFADLVGSGVGSIAVIFLLNNTGMFRTIILVCVFALIPALILPATTIKFKVVGYILPVLLIAGFLLPGQFVSSIEQNFKGILNNTAKTFGNIKKSGMSPEIVFSKWNAFSRTDVIKVLKEPNEMILTIDGAANAPMYRFDGDIGSLEKFKADTGFLPFTIGSSSKTLLIGPGGGRDVLYALAGGSKNITAVEINTASIDAVKTMGEYNGNVYNRPEVKVYGEDGRSFVRKSRDKYDLIFLSLVMTNTSQGMGYALSENYIYTVEAMKDYLDHLNDNGKIAFLAHDQEDLSKIVATAIRALENEGISIKDVPDHIALFTKLMPPEHGGTNMLNPMIIIKNKPFSEGESRELFGTAQKYGSIPMFIPSIYEQGPLQLIKKEQISMVDYLNNFSTNVTPATDDRPYFFNFGKGVPSILLIILLVVIIGSILLFRSFVVKGGNFKSTMYFSLLGVGFMMIEVPLIQKFILYLGHPALAFTYVLAALLIGCGLGGYLSNNRLFNRTIKVFYLPPVIVVIINIILLLSLGFIFQRTSTLDLTGRIIVASLLVMLQGFFMGMPFPRGLKLIGESGRGEIVPIMWGVNGATSVIGSVLSIILSMSIGFTGALIAGAVIYLIVSFYKTL
ncbi:MAG: hypothetical protein Q7J78_04100 [Clostridiales bacterium]|nr:hypothetical protein [Clostridiales bacterium]